MNYYVVCPGHFKTGGTELMHQFVHQLNHMGRTCKIAYYDCGYGVEKNEAFNCYDTPICLAEMIPDESTTVVVVPEIVPEFLTRFDKAKRVIWWTSVDNFKLLFDSRLKYRLHGVLRAIKHELTKRRIDYVGIVKTCVDMHLVQSEYARDYIQALGTHKMILHLSDYVNECYIQNSVENLKKPKTKQVLFNPSKGYGFTKRIIRRLPDVKWVPLKGYSNAELQAILSSSCTYIDFGNHPGKDRLPRECAISGCCVIVGTSGAARFVEDYPLPEWARFEATERNIPEICRSIELSLASYDALIQDFASYREMIIGERDRFTSDLHSFINTIESGV